MQDSLLASLELCSAYCSAPPFAPDEKFPEYPFDEISPEPNPVYRAVRQHFFNLGLDRENFGDACWDPLGDFDLSGKRIVIKPNWVMHRHPDGADIWSLITHPSWIRAALDYIYIATQGNCRVVIGDSPLQNADFEQLLQVCRMKELQSYYAERGLAFKLEDFRQKKAVCNRKGQVLRTVTLCEDSDRFCVIDMAERSLLTEIEQDYKRFRVTNYDKRQMRRRHRPGRHQYVIANAVMQCDFLLSMPKAKTHRKVGATLALKNMIGVNCTKDCLPHHRQGAKSPSADEYERFFLLQWLGVWFTEWGQMYEFQLLRRPLVWLGRLFWFLHRRLRRLLGQSYYREGSWHGNDTIWRTCLDINKIVRYADREGVIKEEGGRRKYLVIIDGVMAGEREGPLHPTPLAAGFSVAAFNPAVADFTAAAAMGFEPMALPVIANAFAKGESSPGGLPLCTGDPEEIEVRSSAPEYCAKGGRPKCVKKFTPASGWIDRLA